MANIEIRQESPSAFYIKVHEPIMSQLLLMTTALKPEHVFRMAWN